MGPAAGDRYYGRDPYYEGRAPRDDRPAGSGYYADRRAAGPPPPPRDVPPHDPYAAGPGGILRRGPPLRHPGGPGDGPGPPGGPRPPAEWFDSDIESVTSAFSSQSAPHARHRRPG